MTDEIVLTSDERANNAALMPIMGMDLARGRYQALVDFTRDIMREGTDFGTIPGTGKPTLLKPGSEKLFTFFGLRTAPRVTLRTEDWEKGFFAYEVECDVFRGDTRITVNSTGGHTGAVRWWRPSRGRSMRRERIDRRDESLTPGGTAPREAHARTPHRGVR